MAEWVRPQLERSRGRDEASVRARFVRLCSKDENPAASVSPSDPPRGEVSACRMKAGAFVVMTIGHSDAGWRPYRVGVARSRAAPDGCSRDPADGARTRAVLPPRAVRAAGPDPTRQSNRRRNTLRLNETPGRTHRYPGGDRPGDSHAGCADSHTAATLNRAPSVAAFEQRLHRSPRPNGTWSATLLEVSPTARGSEGDRSRWGFVMPRRGLTNWPPRRCVVRVPRARPSFPRR